MPYIPDDRRQVMARGAVPATPGELNYELTRVVLNYLHGHTLNYSTINDILGALEGCKLEFYRRVAVPYEEGKRAQNGDVF